MNNSQLIARHSQLTTRNLLPTTDHFHSTTNNSQPAHNSSLHQLREKIRAVETENRRDDGILIKHGCEAIDRLLPDGGYSRGTLIQWISGGGQGAEYLSLRVAQQACQSGGGLVIADPCKQFFPPAAAAMGIDLNHLIVLQTTNEKDLLWGIDQALRCPAVGAVWGWLDGIEERQFRRFQLSAESSGAIGLFLQPYTAVRKPSWADVQWLVGMGASSSEKVASLHSSYDGFTRLQTSSDRLMRLQTSSDKFDKSAGLRIVSLQLTRCRGTHTGKSIRLTIDPVTGVIEPASRRLEASERLRPANPRTMPKPNDGIRSPDF